MNGNLKNSFTAEEVTNTFFDFYSEYDLIGRISNIVAQKLNYIANGYWLAFSHNRLIKENFEAWNLGPVIPDLYHKLKKYGNGHIDYLYPSEEDEKEVTIKKVNEDKVIDFLNFIFESFKDYTPGELIELTHRENGAWYTAFQKGANIVIDDDLIKKEFKELFYLVNE